MCKESNRTKWGWDRDMRTGNRAGHLSAFNRWYLRGRGRALLLVERLELRDESARGIELSFFVRACAEWRLVVRPA
jgi:hypothetical protein